MQGSPFTASVSRLETPLGGTLVILAAGLLAILLGGVTRLGNLVKLPNNIEAFQISAWAGSFLVEAVYLTLALVALHLVFTGFRGLGRVVRLVVTLLGIATPVLAYYYGSLHPFHAYPNDLSAIIAGGCGVIALVWLLVLRARRPERIAAAARHALEHRGVPALDEPLADRTQRDGRGGLAGPPRRRGAATRQRAPRRRRDGAGVPRGGTVTAPACP